MGAVHEALLPAVEPGRMLDVTAFGTPGSVALTIDVVSITGHIRGVLGGATLGHGAARQLRDLLLEAFPLEGP